MKKLLAIAALLLASTAAQAQYTFEYGGRTIRVDPDRGTVSIPGVYDNTGRKAKRSRNEDGDRDRPRKQSPQQAKTDPQTTPDAAVPVAPAPSEQAVVPATPPLVPAAPAPATASTPEPSTTTAAVAPADTVTSSPPPAPPASHRCGRAARTSRTRTCPGGCSGIKLAAWRVADRGKGRQSPDRTVRHQPLRIFRRQEVEPERRTGSDQHEARQGFQMERPDSRSEHRQHL